MRRAWLIIDGAAYRHLIMICQKKGERIIFFCQEDDGSYRLYLMMVVAADEECYPFVKGKHEIIMKDDCCPFGLYTDNLQFAVSLSIQAGTPDRRSS